MASNLSDITQLIPPNPAALDFEEQFRANLELFLSSMQDFEGQFNTTIGTLQGDSATLNDAISTISSGSDIVISSISEALSTTNSGTLDWNYTDSSGNTTLVSSSLDFSSLSHRFSDVESKISLKSDQTSLDSTNANVTSQANLLTNAITNVGDGTGNTLGTAFSSIEARFFQSEDLISKAYSVKKDMINNSNSDTLTTYNSIEERFSSLEDSISSTSGSLSGYAQIAGDSNQDFSIKDLTIASDINFTNPAAALTGLQMATIHDLTVSNLLTLNQDPTNPTDAVRLSYTNTNFAKLTGLNTQTFEVLTDDSQANAEEQAINKAYADGRFAPIAGDAGNSFEASTLKLNGALDMNSNLINNLTDPVIAQDAVTLNYLQNNYTDSNDLGTNYAAIGGSNTEDFDIFKLTVHDDVDMNFKFITNLPDPAGTGHAVNYDYLVNNYTTSSDLVANYAQKNGDSLIDFSANNLNISGALNLTGGSSIDLQGLSKVINAPSPANSGDVTPKSYVDTLGTNLDSRISNLETGVKLPDTTGYNAKFLMVKTDGSGITWADPPDLDPSLMVSTPYDWVPSVPWQSIQFDGEVYSSRTLAAGFTYFVAGDLRVADFDSLGNAVELKIESGSGAVDGLGYPVKGAVLIVQGHIIGNIDGVKVDTVSPHKGRLVVLNWSDSKADYVIPEVTGQINQVTTSSLNLIGKNQFSCKLVMEANTELIIDSECELIFKEADLDPSSVITINNNHLTGNPFGSVSYFDPIKIIENAPAALDTLSEIAAILQDPNTGNVVNLFSKIEGDIQTVTSLTNQAQDDATQALLDAATAQSSISNISLGNLSFSTESSTGDLVYKFNP